MRNHEQTCPEPEVFVEFLTGKLEEDQLKRLEAHLSNCTACGDTVRSLHVEDTFINLVGSGEADQTSDVNADTELQQLMVKLESLADSRTDADASHDIPAEDLQARVREVELLLAPAVDENEVGRLAHYRILKLLGAGGMGVVYQAEDTKLQRLVALKILRPSLGRAACERFIQEARAAAAIDHDHVVTIYNVGSEGPLAYLAMQWLDGETLESRLKREDRLSAEEVIEIGSQIADGLAAAHAKKLIHRDIKPANILLEAGRGRAKILDFGLAQVVDDNAQLTETGMIAGTPAYMSPEQAQGRAVDERSDLFSLGTMLYRMLTGELPFDASNALATIRAIQNDTPTAPRQIDMDIPAVLSDHVMDLLEKDPRSRPTDSQVVAESLRNGTRPDCPGATNEVRVQTDTSKGNSNWRTLVPVLLACGGLLASPMIYRIATDDGEIVVKTDDPNVQVEVMRGGNLVTVIDPKTNDTVTIDSGTYQLQLKDKSSEFSVTPRQVTLTRKGKEVVTVTKTLTESATLGAAGNVTESNNAAESNEELLIGKSFLPRANKPVEPGSIETESPGSEQRIAAGSRIRIQVAGTIPEQPIDGDYIVEPSGKVALGPAYGRAFIAGCTYEEAEKAITVKLKEIVTAPQVLVTMPKDPMPSARTTGTAFGASTAMPPSATKDELRRFDLRYAHSQQVRLDYEQLYPNSSLRIVDSSPNSLFVATDSPQELEIFQEFIDALDIPSSREVEHGRNSDEALYDGKPYSHWLEVVRIEKSREQLAKAFDAMAALTTKANSDTTCTSIFDLIREIGPAYGDLRSAVREAVHACDPDVLTINVVRQLAEGNSYSHDFISNQIWERYEPPTVQWASFSRHSNAICDRLIALGEKAKSRAWVTNALAVFCSKADLDSATIDSVLPTLQAEFQKGDFETRLTVAMALARQAPNSDGLIEFLVEVLQFDDKENRANRKRNSEMVFRIVEILGPQAEPVLPTLLEILPNWVEVDGNSKLRVHNGYASMLIQSIGEIGPVAIDALPVLRDYIATDRNSTGLSGQSVARAAKEALAKIETTSSTDEQANPGF